MAKTILELLHDELVKTQQELQDLEKRESDILKAIKAIESDEKKGVIEQGDTVRVIDIDLTQSRYSHVGGMYGIGDTFTVTSINEDSNGFLKAYDSDSYCYALEDLKLVEKKS